MYPYRHNNRCWHQKRTHGKADQLAHSHAGAVGRDQRRGYIRRGPKSFEALRQALLFIHTARAALRCRILDMRDQLLSDVKTQLPVVLQPLGGCIRYPLNVWRTHARTACAAWAAKRTAFTAAAKLAHSLALLSSIA